MPVCTQLLYIYNNPKVATRKIYNNPKDFVHALLMHYLFILGHDGS